MADESGDDALVEVLRAGSGPLESVPPAVLEAAQSIFAQRADGDELAELAYDSLVDDDAEPMEDAVRRILRFRASDLSVELEVSAVGALRSLTGRLSPRRSGTAEVHHAGGAVTVQVDQLGRFEAAELLAGPGRLKIRTSQSSGTTVATDWVLL